MNNLRKEQKKVKDLVSKVAGGDCDSFAELEGLAKPLMTHLSDYFSNLHYKFEFEDFYAICMNALYEACLEYNPKNPSFFSYAKSFMLRQCWRELEYWNAEMRNIFEQDEISCDLKLTDMDDKMRFQFQLVAEEQVEDIAEINDFRSKVAEIITSLFEDDKATIMKLYIIDDMSPKDISVKTGTHYQNTYTTIRRGMKKVAKEYQSRYILDK